jgi:hypothetical protein
MMMVAIERCHTGESGESLGTVRANRVTHHPLDGRASQHVRYRLSVPYFRVSEEF